MKEKWKGHSERRTAQSECQAGAGARLPVCEGGSGRAARETQLDPRGRKYNMGQEGGVQDVTPQQDWT